MSFFNPTIFLCVLSWFLAQVAKGVIQYITEKKVTLHRVLASGGMPSSHSAFVTCCAMCNGFLYGFNSGMFSIAVCLAVVVMYDACNVRRRSGEQAQVLNIMLENWEHMTPELIDKQVKVLLGHTPLQVFFGALLGIIVSVAYQLLR